jgi:hypothetical protein
MSPRLYKTLLVLAAVVLLAGAGQFQNLVNRQRVAMGLTPLPKDPAMPPVLALTTQALGGFRGLMANALWIRANDLQLEDKYFEMVQLARWITILDPKSVQGWIHQAWNMTYNISVKFNEPADRWRWVRHGLELLRDEGLKYNPDEALIYRELAWFFQHKMGANLDEAHRWYKAAWAGEMMSVLTTNNNSRWLARWDGHPDFEELLHPNSDEGRRRAQLLGEKYKLDARRMQEVDQHFGPFDWRLPEAHAIYWAWLGLTQSKSKDLITLRRVIYQSMKDSLDRGRMRVGSGDQLYFVPNLQVIPRADAAFREMLRDETEANQRESIKKAHKNFLRDAVYQLYVHNRTTLAERWFKTLRTDYPEAVPAGATLSDYALDRAIEEVQTGAQARVASLVVGLIEKSYLFLVEDEDDEATGYMQRAQELHAAYMRKSGERLKIMPFAEMVKYVREQLLDPKGPLTPLGRDQLRKKLGLPAAPPMEPGKPAGTG